MSGDPENPMLVFLRRIDAKVDRLAEDMADVRQRLTSLEIQVAKAAATEASHYAQIMLRLDRNEQRLDRIERRVDLVETP
ncbi:MAG: hypothetical protein EXR07_03870 [Acetobacteraceae bacterium]|nr:hypothetical protein [Acetobacteraceae bacterium]